MEGRQPEPGPASLDLGRGRGISADPKREAVADSYHAILCWPLRLYGSFVKCVVKPTVHLLCASHTVL